MSRKSLVSYKNVFLSLILVSLAFPMVVSGQTDDRESRIYETGEFTELFLEGAFGVELIQGNTSSLEVRATDSSAFEYLKVTNRRGLLHLHVDRKPFDFSKVTLYVTFKDLEDLRILGGINLSTRGYLDLDDLEMLLEGGAKVNLEVKAQQIHIDNRGGVLVELSGIAKSLDVRVAGAGHINAGELKTEDVNFRIEGVGTGKVFATETLNAVIKGAGKIKYKGNPEVSQSIEGLGVVERD